ncbi:UDP-N-acetyl-D-glucosamine dehydrogenase [Wenjunlia vitaminophila]|uniref:UDP-N-acetyl-D-glucosamine dehydrogenase n=1 Tax=Wenjunlia vitaminophila TaxID=76728 RepID=A0A0T6LP64_WENVI|nr:nucleotide sugar dehydrogenase [Wenjunlia vitaminophila]KRV47682.1 UDP-N-acetyl-D-glucosamine dehydrogenase [Wenjunlia vitaminophila]
MPEKLVVVGQGYVGLPLAAAAAEHGYQVVGYDTDESRVKMLAVGESYVGDVDSARLAAVLDRGTYRPSMAPDDLADFDIAVIAVPTPLHQGNPDVSYIEAAGSILGPRLRPGCTVVLESTSYPGTTEDVLAPVLASESGLEPGVDFHLGYSPERIDPGNRTWTFENTPKVVSGVNEKSLSKVAEFYDSIVNEVVRAGSPRVAELAKVLENTFRHVNVALVNELAIHAEGLGIDVWDVLDIAATKPFGFMRFTPGPGVGGHCLPVDPLYLSWKVERALSRRFRLVELADELNSQMPEYVVRRLTRSLDRRRQTLTGARILMLGLSYKANTGDVRESPALEIARLLIGAGASVRAVDPHVTEPPDVPGLTVVELTREQLGAAHAVLIVTDHDSFDYPDIAASARYVLDCRRRLTPAENVESL